MSTLKWTVDLDAKTGIATLKQFEQAQKKTTAQMGAQSKQAGVLNSAFGGLQKSLLNLGGVIGGGLLVRGFAHMISNLADTADNIAKTSRSLGISTEAFQKFSYVAERSGISIEAMNKSMQYLIRNVGDAADGTGEAKAAFEKLGLQAADLKNLKPEEMFIRVTDAVNKLESSTDRAQVMYRIFGRSGIELRKITEGGSDAIREMMQRFEDLGGVMSTELLDAAEEYKDAMLDLETVLKGFKYTIGSEIIPLLNKLIRAETDGIAGLKLYIEDLRGVSKDAQLRNINTELLTLYTQIDALRNQPEITNIVNRWFGHDVDAEITELQNRIQELINKRSQLMAAPPPGGGGPGTGREDGGEDFVSRIMSEEERKEQIYAEWRRVHAEYELQFVTEQEQLRREQEANELLARQEYLATVMGLEVDHLQERISQHQWAADAENRINMMRATAQQSWMGVAYTAMQIFGARSQKWMLAMIAVETAINVARALIFGHAATVKALAEVPYPANLAVAAQMQAMMWWNVGAIIAAGALKAYGTATGGAGAGGGAATVPTYLGEGLVTTPVETIEKRGQLIINIDNFIGDAEWIDHLVERINEAGDERDVVIRGDVRAYE